MLRSNILLPQREQEIVVKKVHISTSFIFPVSQVKVYQFSHRSLPYKSAGLTDQWKSLTDTNKIQSL